MIGLERRKYKASIEDRPGDTLLDPLIEHYLYGDRFGGDAAKEAAQLERATGRLADLAEAELKDANFWGELLRSQVLEAPRVTLLAKPSAALAERNSAAEKAREKAQAEGVCEKERKSSCKGLSFYFFVCVCVVWVLRFR